MDNVRDDVPAYGYRTSATDGIVVQKDNKRLDKALREEQLGYVSIQQTILILVTMAYSHFLQNLLNIYVRASPIYTKCCHLELLVETRKVMAKNINNFIAYNYTVIATAYFIFSNICINICGC